MADNQFVGYVQPDETWIVERFGKFSRSLGPGFHLVLPFVDKVKAIKPNVPTSMGVMTRSVQTKGTLQLPVPRLWSDLTDCVNTR